MRWQIWIIEPLHAFAPFTYRKFVIRITGSGHFCIYINVLEVFNRLIWHHLSMLIETFIRSARLQWSHVPCTPCFDHCRFDLLPQFWLIKLINFWLIYNIIWILNIIIFLWLLLINPTLLVICIILLLIELSWQMKHFLFIVSQIVN